MSLTQRMTALAKAAKEASYEVAVLDNRKKKHLLRDMAKALRKHVPELLKANEKDVRAAREKGRPSAMVDRLQLTEKRIEEMALSMDEVADLKDPVNMMLKQWKRPNGLKIAKVSVPLGVVLIIYEARPNVTAECMSLALKSGNSVILKGGSESLHSNTALVALFKEVLKRYRIHEGAVSFVNTTDHKAVDELVVLSEYITVVIPRGGESLIRSVVAKSEIPVIKHYQGICHVYVDKDADCEKAEKIVLNAKLQRPSVCNATECLLVHEKIAEQFLPACIDRLQESGCEIRGCDATRQLMKKHVPFKPIKKATNADYGTEFLDRILAVRIVSSVEEAVTHIETYGSHHTDAIVTRNRKAAQFFTSHVDSSSVMVNASTRFSDGYQYGFGAEVGISTDKIHARGPMGLDGLTSYKYIVVGDGHVRG